MGVCRIADKSYYVSFDGHYHAIRSTCAYVLVKTCHFTTNLPFFKISGENEEREGQSPAFYLRQLNISIFDSLITLQKDHHVLVSWATQAGTKEASSGRGLSGPSSYSHALLSSADQWQTGHPSLEQPGPGRQHLCQWYLHCAQTLHWAGSQVRWQWVLRD